MNPEFEVSSVELNKIARKIGKKGKRKTEASETVTASIKEGEALFRYVSDDKDKKIRIPVRTISQGERLIRTDEFLETAEKYKRTPQIRLQLAEEGICAFPSGLAYENLLSYVSWVLMAVTLLGGCFAFAGKLNEGNFLTVVSILGLIVYARTDIAKKEEGAEAAFKIDSRVWWALIILLMLTRLILFPKIPYGLNQDGVMGALDAKALAHYATDRFGTHLPAHLYAWGYGQMSSLMSYTMAPFIRLFGQNRLTLRLPQIIFSFMGMAALVGASYKLMGKTGSILTGFIIAMNPWHFMQSRWALDCNLFPHFFIAGFLFLIMGTKKKRYYFLSMVFFALCMYCYGVSFYMVPFFLVVSAVYLMVKRKLSFLDLILCLFIYFGLSWPIYTVMVINFMKLETITLPFVTMQFFPDSIRSADLLIFSEHPLKQLLSNLQAFNHVFLQKDDYPWNYVRGIGSMYVCSIPLIIYGLIVLIRDLVRGKENPKTPARMILLFYVIFSVVTGLMIDGVNVNRINILFYSLVLLVAYAAAHLAEGRKMMIPGVVILTYTVMFAAFLHSYYTDWAEDMRSAFFTDFTEAVEYAKGFDADRYYISPDPTPWTENRQISMMLTEFIFDIDSKYVNGETDLYNAEVIPYEEKFCYYNLGDGDYPDPEALYVFKSEQAAAFEDGTYKVKYFGDYGVAIPLKN